jgi:hypothetical protein
LYGFGGFGLFGWSFYLSYKIDRWKKINKSIYLFSLSSPLSIIQPLPKHHPNHPNHQKLNISTGYGKKNHPKTPHFVVGSAKTHQNQAPTALRKKMPRHLRKMPGYFL